MNPIPQDFLYIWAGLPLFTLEYDGLMAYMETHLEQFQVAMPTTLIIWISACDTNSRNMHYFT